jgi:hypothetical protein
MSDLDTMRAMTAAIISTEYKFGDLKFEDDKFQHFLPSVISRMSIEFLQICAKEMYDDARAYIVLQFFKAIEELLEKNAAELEKRVSEQNEEISEKNRCNNEAVIKGLLDLLD